MIIKEIILKANMVIPGYPIKFFDGYPIPITDRTKDGDVMKGCFVSGIKYYPKNSAFVERHTLPFGCYVVSLAKNNEDYCLGKNSKESYIIMEDVVAMVLFS